jgi:hypothetical protein
VTERILASRRATTDISSILQAGVEGRVEALFLALGSRTWGRFDSQTGASVVHGIPEPGDQDLLNLVLHQTLTHHGEVYVMDPAELPDAAAGAVAALLRW